jgi:hypothetical protein
MNWPCLLRGVTVSVNVSSNLRLRSGLPPLAQIAQAGVAMGLGLDGMGQTTMPTCCAKSAWRTCCWANPIGITAARVTLPDSQPVLHAAWSGGRAAILGSDEGGGGSRPARRPIYC